MILHNQKHLFTLDEDITYINGAYMSPMLKKSEQAGIEWILKKQSPNRISPNDFFENSEILRNEFSRLINCIDPNYCAIISSVSYGIATVVNNISLNKGDEIVVVNEQFPSNYYSWDVAANKSGAKLKIISTTNEKERGKSWNENILNAINASTKVVTMPHVHWTDGTKFDLEAIRKACDNVNAYLIIDGTQSVGAMPFDVQEIRPDALVCAGYKWLLGPYSIGMAYYGERFHGGKPIEESWLNRLGSENFANLANYESNYLPSSLRYEMGEHSNFILVPMLIKSIEQLNEWTPQAIQDYCQSITALAIKKLVKAGFWVEEENYRSSHIFGIRVDNLDVQQVKAKLEAAKIYVSIRGNAIRIAPNVYNTEEDMEALVNCLLE